jgi:hypothetical protein
MKENELVHEESIRQIANILSTILDKVTRVKLDKCPR